MENSNAYEKPVTLKNIVKFAVPTIAMTVFMSFYTMVDGLFVSNLIGTDALSAINLTAPVIQLVTAVSTMLATGGSAVIMKKMGEQKTDYRKCYGGTCYVRGRVSGNGFYFCRDEPFSGCRRILCGISEPLSDIHCADPFDEQLYALYDCQRKGGPFPSLFCDGRHFEYGA